MSLIFNDNLQTINTSGLYTLMAFVNGTWTDIHTIAGPSSGSIEVDASVNTITVDTSLLIPGQNYNFKWVDSNGAESNTIYLKIPDTGYPYGGGIGTGNLGTIWLSSVNGQPGNNALTAVATTSGIPAVDFQLKVYDDNGTLVAHSYGVGNNLVAPPVTIYSVYGGPYDLQPGVTYQFQLIDLGSSAVSNIIKITIANYSYSGGGIGTGNLSTIELLSVTNDGGNCAVTYTGAVSESSGLLFLKDITNQTKSGFGGISMSGEISGTNVPMPLDYFPGHEYVILLEDYSGTVLCMSNTIFTPSDSSGSGSAYSYGDGGIGAGNLSSVQLLGVSDDGRGLCAVAYEGLITTAQNQLWLMHTKAGESAFYEAVSLGSVTTGSVFVPNYDIQYLSYVNGDKYQLCLIDTNANPSIDLNYTGNILSNTLTAIDLVINALTEDTGNDPSQGRLIIGYSANVTETGELFFNDTGNGGYYDIGIPTPFSGTNVTYTSQVNYNPGYYVQLVVKGSTGNIIGSSVFKQMP